MMRRQKKHQTQRGGAIIGWGHDDNMVYTLDEVSVLYPDATHVLLMNQDDAEKGEKERGNNSLVVPIENITSTRDGVYLQQGIAVKHVSDPLEYLYEFGINLSVREIFSAAQLMQYTIIHDIFDTAHVLMSGDANTASSPSPSLSLVTKELIYKRMVGSVDRLDSLDEDILVVIMKNCLIFLCVLHAHGFIHMDIKPDNVLYDIHQGKIRCILADYGFLTPMSHVLHRLKKDGSFFQGTAGFISPLLLSDDAENRVYDKFTRVFSEREHVEANLLTNKSGGGVHHGNKVDDFWADFCIRQRRSLTKAPDMAKTDLQSLALTMYSMKEKLLMRRKLLFPSLHGDTDRMILVDRMIARLLLHSPNDFFTAKDALRYLVDYETRLRGGHVNAETQRDVWIALKERAKK